MKKCSRCKELKPKSEYHLNSQSSDNLRPECKECHLNSHRTPSGLGKRIYGHQKRNSKTRNHPMPNYSRVELIEWMVSQENFNKLYDAWVNSNFDKNLTPSCDRIDDYKPYTLSNITLVTWLENKTKSYHDIKSGVNRKRLKPVNQYTKDKKRLIKTHYSIAEAYREIGKPESSGSISKCCKGFIPSAYGFCWEYVKEAGSFNALADWEDTQ